MGPEERSDGSKGRPDCPFFFFFSLMEKRGNRFILFNTESSAVCI